MVRMRARIAEDEEPASALAKLQATLDEHVLDAEERSFVEPKLAQLLGLEQGSSERQELFGAWRLFFERLAEAYPTVMVFEDLQWADQSLLDFVEYLLEWSRSFPLYVLTLSRPELAERRPTWGAGGRNFTSLYLEPLAPEAMRKLLDGLVPGLPETARERILERAEGVPLYAVETARMLLDRGLLVEDGARYRLTGSVESLEVPETLHALIAARLDGLAPDERRLLQDASVLGKTFTRAAVAHISGLEDGAIETALTSLLRKEVLGVQADPRSPEHGQYGFLQDLVRHVAYETLSKRDRFSRHLKAAAHLRSAFPDDDEVVEVLASHYLEAFRLATDADEAAEIGELAREMLLRAGDRAASLAASDEARRYLEKAAELTADPVQRAELLGRAGQMAWKSGSVEHAEAHFQAALAAYQAQGDTHGSARIEGRLAEVEWSSGRLDQAIGRMERALETLVGQDEDEDLAWLLCNLGSSYWFSGDAEHCLQLVERGLHVAESLALPEVIARALFVKALVSSFRGHFEEACALLDHALKLALEHDLADRASASYFNLSDLSFRRDRYRESVEYLNAAWAQGERAGSRLREWEASSELTYPLYMLGEWDRSVATFGEIPMDQIREAGTLISPLSSVLEIEIHRGRLEAAREIFGLYGRLEGSADIQEVSCYAGAKAALARGEGRHADALAAAEEALAAEVTLGFAGQSVKQGFVEGIEAAFMLQKLEWIENLLRRIEALPRGRRPRYLEAHTNRFRARLAGDDAGAEQRFQAAAAIFRELEIPFWCAVTLLEHAEWLRDQSRVTDAELLLADAEATFERLGAAPWIARAARASERDTLQPV